jgi:hypothetical protein
MLRRSRIGNFGFGPTWMLSGWILSVAICATSGCDKSPPPVTDPAKAPWLLDPQSQNDGLKNSDFRIRGLSAFNLGKMGAKAKDAVPLLEQLAKDDPEQKVRDNAREAVEKIKSASNSPSE